VSLHRRSPTVGAQLQVQSGDIARENEVLLGIAPFFHTAGLHGVLNAGIFAGATVVTMRRFDTIRLVRAIEAHHVSSLFLTPPALHALASTPALQEYDHSSLRAVLCAAAPLGAEAEAIAARHLGCVVRQAYGLTETTTPVSNYAATVPIRCGSVGQPVPSTMCRIEQHAAGSSDGPARDRPGRSARPVGPVMAREIARETWEAACAAREITSEQRALARLAIVAPPSYEQVGEALVGSGQQGTSPLSGLRVF
jgi:acyl-coenzyme A synthetase/AMP-(fatty) acid ligase